jgi:hypothetical protein
MMEIPDENEILNNPFILSFDRPLGDRSFIDSRQGFNKTAPPPKYFTEEFLMKEFGQLPTKKEDILFGFEYPEVGGLICTDKEALEKQKGVLSHVVK